MNSGFFSALSLLAVACLFVDAAANPPPDPYAYGGEAPTSWYLTTVAPTLPPWRQQPDRVRPATLSSHIEQGTIELGAFADASLERLICWAESGDKISALAAAVRLERAQPAYRAGEGGRAFVEHYLRIAARDESPSSPCAEPFCHGVPEAMLRLAYFRRIQDDEQRSLLERARDAGVTQAIYALQGIPLPVGRH